MIPAMPGTWAASWAASTARIGAVTCAPCKTNARVLVGRHRRGHGRGPAVVAPDAAERMLDGDLLNSNDLFPPRLRLSFICALLVVASHNLCGGYARSPCAAPRAALEVNAISPEAVPAILGRRRTPGIVLSRDRDHPDTLPVSGTQARDRSYRTRRTRCERFGESISASVPPTRDVAGLGHSSL